jgi:hypothetical protein
LLLRFPNIRTVPYFQRICVLTWCLDFALHSNDKAATYF